MQERTLRVLEFNAIRDMLVKNAVSEMGAELCRALVPETNVNLVRRTLADTEEACVLLTRLGYDPVTPFNDIRQQLRKSEIGAALSMKELLECAACMRTARAVRQALVKKDGESPAGLSRRAEELVSLRELENEINTAIISEEEMADNASAELAAIRRKVRLANERIRERLNSYLHNSNMQIYLQENVITMRSGRYVLPVKQEYRQQVPGLIHDQSATGSTLFIEPMAVVELGNDIRQLQSAEQAEIERILYALTAQVAPYAATLQNNLELLAWLDFVFAKGALARQLRCVEPKMNDSRYLNIKRGRHPLIPSDRVVPIDLWLGRDFTTLIITGPNTGGKTVTLKTVGLFALMAQAGLHVPADLGTELCVFENVFADIGDEQSIEQSLSTFSSHMTNIVDILGNVTPDSLALFDELGAGTDPTEGASLAQAILDRIRKMGALTVATTHYSELKAYALTEEGVQNASVEFNVETLRPTYRLSIGIPGKSNAFEISKRLGLDESVIEQARQKLSTDQIRFEDVISNAEYNRQIAEKERELAESARREITRLQDEIESRRAELEQQREAMMKKAREEARRIINGAKAESEQIIAELKKTAAEQSEITRKTISTRQSLERALEENSERIDGAALASLATPPKSVMVGETVKILSIGANGTVLAKPDEKGMVQVQAGVMKLSVALKDIRPVRASEDAKQKRKNRGGVRANVDMASRYVPLELDVRGQLLDEAIENVDKYIDDAYLASRKEVSIIHGKGTGVLRAGLQEHLKRHPYVESYRLGKFGEGESGVTVIQLK